MSIHVCKCVHNGREEFHLRYPGLTQSEAQQLADKINGGALNQVEHAAAVAEHFQQQIDRLRSELEAARGKVEALTTAARNVVSYRPSMSYNDSYFGEPAGVFKQRVAELDRALSPTSAPMRADCESQNVRDADDMPTEMAVLKREWKAMRLELSMRHSSPPTSA